MKKVFNVSLIAFAAVLFLKLVTGCAKDSLDDTPVLFTGDVQAITGSGALFNGKITGIREKEFVECGFVWSTKTNPVRGKSEFYAITEYPGEKPISVSIRSNLIKGNIYYVRTYCKTKDEILYGQVVSFVSDGSEGPVISKILPSEAFIGDTIKIAGKNFSNTISAINVRFINPGTSLYVAAKILKASFDTITVQIPLTKSVNQTVSVIIGGITKVSDSPFTILTPKVESFSPMSFFPEDTITLYGTNLNKTKATYAVRFGAAAGQILSESDTNYIKVIVPRAIRSATGNITFTASLTTNTLTGYSVLTPSVTSFTPTIFSMGDTITIFGSNLNKSRFSYKVSFGSIYGTILNEVNQNYIKVVVPNTLNSATGSINFTALFTNIILPGYQVISPSVTSFAPSSFFMGDTITVYGERLDIARTTYKIKFGNAYGTILNGTDKDYLKVTVPNTISSATGDIVFTSSLNTITLPGYSIITPTVVSYSPTSFYPDDTVTIYGTNLDHSRSSFNIAFGTNPATVLNEINKGYLKVVVPGFLSAATGTVNFTSALYSENLPVTYTVRPPEIYSVEPVIVKSGSAIKVTGIGFSSYTSSYNSMVINGYSTMATYSSKKVGYYTLRHNSIIFNSRQVSACITTGVLSSGTINMEINDRWLRVRNFPDAGLYSLAVSDGSRAFAGILEHNIFFRFEGPGSYTRMADFPGTARSHSVAFIIGDFLYYGNGIDPNTMSYLNDFWRYDINANTWLKLNDFPFISRQNATGFTNGTYGYITSGATKIDGTMVSLDDCWRYNPSMDSWEQITSYGDLVEGTADALSKPAAVNDGEGTIYVCGKELYGFNTQTGIWTHISSYPDVLSGVTYYGFYRNDKVYIGTSSRLLYAYDTATNTWEQVKTELISGNNYLHMTSFMFNSKIYIGFGRQPAVWEFDPDR